MNFTALFENIKAVHETLQASVSKAINISITIRNWMIGYFIVEFEQNGEDRAAYGEKLLNKLEQQFSGSGIKGMNERRFRDYRQFYSSYYNLGSYIHELLPDDSIRRLLTAGFDTAIRRSVTAELKSTDIQQDKVFISPKILMSKLSYTHFEKTSKITDPLQRAFYEMECIKGNWSVAELERQVESLYFERSGLSKDKKKLSDLINQKAVQLSPKDIINDPLTIEFLGLSDRALVTETDLEQAILDHLQMFLLELGHGFCFEARQKRILIDDEYYFIDLVFYHRILKCHVLVDLKTEKFKHSHVGQINTYLEFYKNEVMQEGDNHPVGILLCTDKGSTLVKYATAGLEQSVFVHKYLIELPSKEELETYLGLELKKTNC
jgi:predicted nuclease of restriction endonuclease-like (RecB) superfamily